MSRGKPCPEINETFKYMLPRWTAEKVGGSYGMISPGSQRNVSNELRPQDPSSGDV